MPKEIIYIEMSNQYPFREKGQKSQGSNNLLVRKTLQYDEQPRFICKEKIRMLKSLGFQNLIGLESTKSQENTIILIFEHVPFQFLAEADTLTEERLSKIQDSMLQLCQSLASRGIIHQIEAKRVGFDKRFNLKYYLGVDFKIDKTVDKQKLAQKYKKVVCQFIFLKSRQPSKIQQSNIPQPNDQANSLSNQVDFQQSVRNLLGLEAPTQRKIMKKSSIIESQSNNEGFKQGKTSTRFTFNYDNQITLPINEKAKETVENKYGGKSLKMHDLSTRINILKDYMREISVKTASKNILVINTTTTPENSCTNQSTRKNKIPQTPNFSRFQKKVNEFRESKLRISSRDQDAFGQKANDKPQSVNRSHASKSFQQPQSPMTQTKATKNIETNQALFNTVAIEPTKPPQSIFAKKNSLNYCEDDRQHQQYVMLANKDEYCAQFMLFLDDRDACDERSQRTVKKTGPNQRPSNTVQSPGEAECKLSRQRQNLKTQSSENTLQIQSRVQKVIRSSLKLISGLRARESIRCE